MPRVLIIGTVDRSRLEASYAAAFRELAWDVNELSMPDLVRKHSRLGSLGPPLLDRVAIAPWLRKISADVVSVTRAAQPDLILLFGLIEQLRVGIVAQLRTFCMARVAWIWPDSMVNWSTHMSAMLPFVDVIATFSQATVPVFRTIGARDVIWLPLAADPLLHGHPGDKAVMAAPEVAFIGTWRPNREEAINTLGDFDVKVWGNGWGRAARSSPLIRRAWQRRPLLGSDQARTVRAAKINLNVIDPGSYPAANMRVFELLVAGGFELSSACPEFEDVLRDGEHLCYFQSTEELPRLVEDLLRRPEDRARVAAAGEREVRTNHTYTDRARTLAQACGF